MRNVEFVNYTQASGLKPRKNSRQVASYVGKSHRNRSAPSSRATLTSTSRRGLGNLTPTMQEPEDRSAVGVQPSPSALIPNTIPRDWAGFRADPFDTLPIRQSKAVSIAIDYCKIARKIYAASFSCPLSQTSLFMLHRTSSNPIQNVLVITQTLFNNISKMYFTGQQCWKQFWR